MVGMNKEIKGTDHLRPNDDAGKQMNKGLTGFMTKTFFGKDTSEEKRRGAAAGRDAIKMLEANQNPELYGLPATALVLSIHDTGRLINLNPVVLMQLKVQPQFEGAFAATVETIICKTAVPVTGDTINIKYSPADRTKIAVIP